MQKLKKFFGKGNIAYNIYSTRLMPINGFITYVFHVFANYYFETNKEWKEQWSTMSSSEENHEVTFISRLEEDGSFLNAEKFKIQNKIYTKQELINKLEELR